VTGSDPRAWARPARRLGGDRLRVEQGCERRAGARCELVGQPSWAPQRRTS